MSHNRPNKRPAKPVVIGTGLVALDVIIADSADTDPVLCTGGTCGNVLTALAYLGWKSYPVARLRGDAASKRIIEDLQLWGVNLDFVSLSDSGSTPVVVQHIRQARDGQRSHSFSRKCPACGAWLPWYKAVRVANVPDLTTRLPKADVFYFDRTSRAAVTLAQHARNEGALVVFEPSAESEPNQLADALEAAHVVKVANDRVNGNSAILKTKSPLLVIETLGSSGLRYVWSDGKKRRSWKKLQAFEVESLRDSAGAGDWCTAGIISSLGSLGPQGLAEAPASTIQTALMKGQAMAAWACRYDGARGGMYVVSRKDFDDTIADILRGKVKIVKETSSPRTRAATAPVWCDCCVAAV